MPVSVEKQAAAKAQRRRVYELRKDGNSWRDIARIESLKVNTAEKYFERAVKVDKLPPLEKLPPSGNAVLMREDPQALGNVLAKVIVADALNVASTEDEKYKALHEAARECGLRPAVVAAMIKRLKASLAPVADEGKRITLAETLDQIDRKKAMLLGYIDDYAAANSSLKDVTTAFGILVDKHQLLSNKPTQIIDVNTRAELVELMPKLLAEARRRGVTVEGAAVRVPDAAVVTA